MATARDIAQSSAMIRRICALLAVVGLFLQGSHGGHMLLVEHSRCAEHGDLVHGAEAHAHLFTDDAETRGRGLERAPEPSDDEAHEHCGHVSERRDAVVDVAQSDVVERSTLTAADPSPAVPAIRNRAPLYRSAPKNSPPA